MQSEGGPKVEIDQGRGLVPQRKSTDMRHAEHADDAYREWMGRSLTMNTRERLPIGSRPEEFRNEDTQTWK